MEEEIKLILLEREPKAYADGSVPGTLYVGAQRFPTIERGGAYASLKTGDYRMVHSRKHTGRKVKCLRPIEENKAYLKKNEKSVESVLIHDAYLDSSHNLKGCISPGMVKKPGSGMGILYAKEAMKEIWKLLGKFREGKQITLHVLNNVPGDLRTKETWDRVRNLNIRRLMQT